MSKEGQEVVIKDGYMPLTPAQVKEELAKIAGGVRPRRCRGGRADSATVPRRSHESQRSRESQSQLRPSSGESAVRRQMAAAAGRIKRLKRIDRVAVGVITFGGIAVILSVIGILVFIGAEAVPLFRPASATLKGTLRPADAVARGADGSLGARQ